MLPLPAADAATELAAASSPPETAAYLARLSGLLTGLQVTPASTLPAPLPAPAGPRDSLRLRPARLSLGLLLGAAPARRGAVPAQLRSLETPAYGASAEVAARYFLTPTLGLRTGLGYAVQRQQLALAVEKRQSYWASTVQVVVLNNPTGPDTVRVLGYALRDSLLSRESRRFQLAQRYLTLPLAAEWRPRIPFRWQPVLSLGATANWLLSGSYLSTTDGCNCREQTQRGSKAGPFAPASVALSAGLGLDYALSQRTTLLLRPTATYWLVPSSRGGTARPLSAGLQVGLLFDTHRP